jgi:hypothetical protein
MTIRRVPEITPDRENFRLEPVGTYIAMVFRVTGYDRDCDGSLMARLECVDAAGETTGWTPVNLSLYPDSAWVLDGPGELDRLADEEERQ